jgi:hypothetical protein
MLAKLVPDLRCARNGTPTSGSTDAPRPTLTVIMIIFLCILIYLFAGEAPAQDPRQPRSVPENDSEVPQPAPPISSQAQPSVESAPRVEWSLNPAHLLLGIALGLCFGMARLLSKFYRVLGLGVLMNMHSGLFLGMVAVYTGVTYMLFERTEMLGAMANEVKILSNVFGSTVIRNLTTVLGRLARRSSLHTGATDQVKELKESESSNFFFHMILESIAEGMHRKLAQMARQYDWDLIKEAVSSLTENQMALGILSREKGEASLRSIRDFEPCADARTDRHNKYKALHSVMAMEVCSFRQLHSRLKSLANEQS